MDVQEAFGHLQPACTAVAQGGNVDTIIGLRRTVERIIGSEAQKQNDDGWTSVIDELKEYILFPLIVFLKSGKKCSWQMLEEIVGCMRVTITRSHIDEFNFFQDIFTQLFLILTSKDDPQKIGQVSEECKEITLSCVETLAKNTTDKVKKDVYGASFRPQLGHAVFVCLKMAGQEKNRKIKVGAVDALLALGRSDQLGNLGSSSREQLSTTFAAFLPGIVTGLAKVANADETQGHKVTVAALDGWAYFVSLVLRDSYIKAKVGSPESATMADLRKKLRLDTPGKTVPKKKDINMEKRGKLDFPEPEEIAPKVGVEVTAEWVRDTTSKLSVILTSLAKLTSHSHWQVRLALLHLARCLLTTCNKSMVSSVITTIEIIVTLRSDSVIDVSTAAREAMADVSAALQSKKDKQYERHSLSELLEERVYALATRLPTTIRQQDDRCSLSCLQQLLGCVEVLGGGVATLMGRPSHAQRLLRALATALTLDTTDSDLMLERASQQDPLENLNVKPQLGQSFRYFRDTNLLNTLAEMLQVIGRKADLTLVVDLCLDILQETQWQRKEFLLILGFILKGKPYIKTAEPPSDKQDILNTENVKKVSEDVSLEAETSAVEAILDVIMPYLSIPTACHVSAHNHYNEESSRTMQELVPMKSSSNISVEAVRENIVVVANTLRVIGSCAVRLGPEFIIYLRRVLCDLMEKAGDSNVLVAHTAREILVSVAAACGHNSAAELIEKSFPHFWFTLSTRLKRLNQHPQAPLVLQVALEFVSLNVMNYMEDLAEEILLSLDAYHHQPSGAAPLLRVLLVYVLAVAKHDKTQAKQAKTRHKGKSPESNEKLEKSDKEASEKLGEIALFLIDHHKTQGTIRDAFNEDTQKDNSLLCGQEGFEEHYRKNILEKDNDFNNDNRENNDEISDDKVKPPHYIELVVKILERCSYLLYTHDRKLQLVILEIICGGCSALVDWEDQRLPAMHILWKPLVLRLKDKDFVVVMRSLETLSEMVSSSGEFLRKRSQEEVLPYLWDFLLNQANTSMDKGNPAAAYRMTQAYRAQLRLLRNVPKIYQSLNLDSLQVSKLMEAIVPYLDTRQPIELCSAAVEIVTVVAANHHHHIWLTLAHLHQPGLLTHPNPLLKPIKITGSGSSHLPVAVTHLYQQLS